MTRPEQKQAERRTLNAVLSALDLRPDREPEEGEAPDFMMSVSGKTIGVEITMYRSGAKVDGGMERRKVETEWDILQRESETFRRQRAELANINVGLMFRGPVPPRKQHIHFLEEIAVFVRDRAAELKAEDRGYWPQEFSTPLMRAYLRTLYLRTDRFAVWYANITGGYVARRWREGPGSNGML